MPSLALLDSSWPILSIRQPWAWFLLHAGKDVENRSWPTRYRGRFYLHASKGCTRAEYDDACAFARLRCGVEGAVPPLAELARGGVVGHAEIVDCVSAAASPWFVGDYGFVVRDAQPMDFLQLRGALGFFRAAA